MTTTNGGNDALSQAIADAIARLGPTPKAPLEVGQSYLDVLNPVFHALGFNVGQWKPILSPCRPARTSPSTRRRRRARRR